MGTLNDWDVTDANNNDAPPDGWPENTMNYSDVNNTGRAVQGTLKRFFADINGSLDAAGIADAYTLTLNESGYAAYFDGMLFSCTIPIINATTTPTIDVNGIGAANIVSREGTAIGVGELHAGGVYDFRHDGTNVRVVGGQGVAGADNEFQYNNAGEQAGTPGLTYDDGTDEATAVNALNFTTEAVFAEQADHTTTAGAAIGLVWLRDDGNLIYTDPTGVDTAIGTTGTSLPGGADTQVQYNDSGVFGADANFVWTGTQLGLISAELGTDVLDIAANSLTTGSAINISADGLVTGYAIDIDIGDTGNLTAGGGLRIVGPATGGSGLASGLLSSISNADHAAIAAFANGTGAGAIAITAYSNVASRTDPLVFFENDNSSAGVPALRIQQDDTSQPAIDLVTTGQIKFPASAQVSSDVNTLDDYEEGTWTPVFWDASLSDGEGQTYFTQEGTYVKIGKLVFIVGRLQIDSLGTLSGAVNVGGLPFAAASVDATTFAILCDDVSGFMGSMPDNSPVILRVENGLSHGSLKYSSTDSNISPVIWTFITSGTGRINFSGSYIAED